MVASTMSSLCISPHPLGHYGAATIDVINPRVRIIKKMGFICREKEAERYGG